MMMVLVNAVVVVYTRMTRSNDDIYLLISNTALDDTDFECPNQYMFLSTASRHSLYSIAVYHLVMLITKLQQMYTCNQQNAQVM